MLLSAAVAAGCGRQEPVLVVATSPADAVVAVDGFAHPGASPHKIVFKAPGQYRLSISREGYRPVEMQVTLGPGERREQTVELVADMPTIPPDPPPFTDPPPIPYPLDIPTDPPVDGFTLRVTATPAGAQVLVREPGAYQARPLGEVPVTAFLPVGGASEVFVSRPGYQTHRRLVVAPVDGGEVHLDVVLARKGGGTRDPDIGPIIVDPPIGKDPWAKGHLSVATTPWSAVHIDGKPMGNTPLVRVELATGNHQVLMENRDLGVRRKKTVFIRAGEHVRLVENLQ
ncbi:MAG TPA: PEGA domain-containing protein [Polyangia bacterium]|nr:PEGA domain-containing protein [Polyangia bacterium]